MTQSQEDAIMAAGTIFLTAELNYQKLKAAEAITLAAQTAAYQDETIGQPARAAADLAKCRQVYAAATDAQKAAFDAASNAYTTMIAAEQAYQKAIADSLQTGADPAGVL